MCAASVVSLLICTSAARPSSTCHVFPEATPQTGMQCKWGGNALGKRLKSVQDVHAGKGCAEASVGDVIHFVVEVVSRLPLPMQVEGATVLLSVLSVRPCRVLCLHTQLAGFQCICSCSCSIEA